MTVIEDQLLGSLGEFTRNHMWMPMVRIHPQVLGSPTPPATIRLGSQRQQKNGGDCGLVHSGGVNRNTTTNH